MDSYQIKLGSLNLDPEKDKYIIRFMENLKESHKLQEFIKSALSIIVEEPELLLNQTAFEKFINSYLEFSGNLAKDKFILESKKDVMEMQRKIDIMYEKTMEMYMLALFGKRNGLEDKSKNTLSAMFILEQQVSSLSKTLGTGIFTEFSSNKMKEQDEWADKTLAYILESYDGVIRECVNNAKISKLAMENERTYDNTSQDREPLFKPINNEFNTKGVKEDEDIIDLDVQKEESAPGIDFEAADLALAFFNQ